MIQFFLFFVTMVLSYTVEEVVKTEVSYRLLLACHISVQRL